MWKRFYMKKIIYKSMKRFGKEERLKNKKVNSMKYTCLEIFARQTADGGRVCVLTRNDDGSREILEKPAGRNCFAWLKISLEEHTEYETSKDRWGR